MEEGVMGMSLPVVSGLVVLTLVLGACWPGGVSRADELQWRSYHSPEVGFRVEVPGEMVHDVDEHWTIAGRVSQHRYASRHLGTRLDVERHMMPRTATLFVSTSGLLRMARDGLMEDLGFEPDVEEEIALGGYPGLRFVFRRDSGPEERRLYLAGRYLYLVTAGPWDPDRMEAIVEHFFDSFMICPKDSTACDPPDEITPVGTEPAPRDQQPD